MGLAQKLSTLDAQQGIRNIMAEREAYQNQLAIAKEENARLVTELQQQKERLDKLVDFEPLLEEDVKYLRVDLHDTAVIRQLRARCVKIYKKRGDPTVLQDAQARRQARLNIGGVVEACVKFCMEPGRFKQVQSRFL